MDNTSDNERSKVLVEDSYGIVEQMVYNWSIEYVLVDGLWENVE